LKVKVVKHIMYDLQGSLGIIPSGIFPVIFVASSVGVVCENLLQKAIYFSNKKLSFDVLFHLIHQYDKSIHTRAYHRC
jgi:hypothetical protein